MLNLSRRSFLASLAALPVAVKAFKATSPPEPRIISDRIMVTIPSLGALSRLRGKRISTALYYDITTAQAVGYVLDEVKWPKRERIIHQARKTLTHWQVINQDAFDALNQLIIAEGPGACFYEDESGNLVFETGGK